MRNLGKPMSTSLFQSYEIIYSRSKDPTVIIDGIQLHSIYNPRKEAENFIEQNLSNIKKSANILVLGLGLGYHLLYLIKKLNSEFPSSQKTIWVIDPLKRNEIEYQQQGIANEVLQEINSHENSGGLKLNICTEKTPLEIYQNYSFVNFLIKSPTIIAHPATFNHFGNYFKEILNYRATDKMSDIIEKTNSESLKKYLKGFKSHQSFSHAFQVELQSRHQLNSYDFIALAFLEIGDQGASNLTNPKNVSQNQSRIEQ